MGVEVLDKVRVDVSPPGVRLLREDALLFYAHGEHPDDIRSQAGRPERQDDSVVHYDHFDDARIIACKADSKGRLSPEDRRHVDIQRASKITESMGAFDNQVEVPLIDGWLVSFGEKETRTRGRAVLAAFAMEQADPGYGFYVWRTLYENRHKGKEHDMMRAQAVPVGAAMAMVSPCESSVYGERLGMFPERNMAILQISWKVSAEKMVLRCVSLDRASLAIITQMLEEKGVKVSPDAKPEDYLAYVVPEHFDSQKELDDYVESFIRRFDELVIKENPALEDVPRQGVVGYDARSTHGSIDQIIGTPHGQLALDQLHKLDVLVSHHVLEATEISSEVSDLAKACIDGVRSDGSPLLLPPEKAAIAGLLEAKKVSLESPDHAKGLKLVMEVHSSAVEESLRDFLSGKKDAMNWMLSEGLSSVDIRKVVKVGVVAIENGRGSGGCGGGAEISSGLPDAKRFPNLYMIKKYGHGAIRWGSCRGCNEWRLVSVCAPGFCGTCDWKMNSRHQR